MPDDPNLARALGRIEGQQVEILKEQEKAAEARKATYGQLESIRRAMDSIQSEAQRTNERLDKVEKPVAEFSLWRERATGALMLLSFVSAAVGATMAAGWKVILRWLSGSG